VGAREVVWAHGFVGMVDFVANRNAARPNQMAMASAGARSQGPCPGDRDHSG
jgi:hypothetical protein